jgi:TonB family protein
MMLGSLFNHPAPAPETPVTTTSTSSSTGTQTTTQATDNDIPKAIKLATTMAGFKEAAPAGYEWKDTSKLTDPKPSFGLSSEMRNNDLVFVLWPNQGPVADIKSVARNLPFLNWHFEDRAYNIIDQGASDHVTRLTARFTDEKGKTQTGFIGAFKAKEDPNCFLVIAKAATPDKPWDAGLNAQLIEDMFAPASEQASSGEENKSFATGDQLNDYRTKMVAVITGNYKVPKAEETASPKVVIEFTIDTSGKITKIAIKKSGSEDGTQALQKAINQGAPYATPPPTKDGSFSVVVTARDGKITVDEP